MSYLIFYEVDITLSTLSESGTCPDVLLLLLILFLFCTSRFLNGLFIYNFAVEIREKNSMSFGYCSESWFASDGYQ